MNDQLESEINLLVSDILDGNSYSHCRLCLQRIEDSRFARLYDTVGFAATSKEYVPLHDVLNKIFGSEVCNEIAGLDAICSGCLYKTLEIYSFIQQCEEASRRLSKVLDNLYATLSDDINTANGNQAMYILCDEKASQLIYVQSNTFVQNKEIVLKKQYVQHKRKKTIPKVPVKCYSCKEFCSNIEGLVDHNREQHDLFTCERCMYTSKNEASVLKHRTSVLFYKCDNCSQFRCTEESLKDHKHRTHSNHVCKECGKSYKGLEKLLSHEEKHTWAKNECPKCGKSYITKEYFEKHVALCLEDRVELHPMRSRILKTYICPTCNKGYSTRGGLRVHMRFVHGNAEHHVCKQCGKKFTAPCFLKVHMVTHTKEKNFPCDLCDGKFVSKEALLYHRRRHTGEKPYICDTCGEGFVNASARVEHIKFKHIGPTLTCDICSRKFVTKNIMRIHLEKHYDSTNKLYIGRADIPHKVPGNQDKHEKY